jgi:rapamycin-insensitive companion of mTOR
MTTTVQAAGRIFELASDQSSALHRIVGTNALSSLDSFNRHRTRLNPPSVKTIRLRWGEQLT